MEVTLYRDYNEGYPSLYIGDEDSLVTLLAEEQGDTEDGIRSEYMFESETIDIPTQTIYTIAGQSDGYISTFYSTDERLLDWWYEADEEYFGATDSDDSFDCALFPEHKLLDVSDVMDLLHDECVQRSALEYLGEHHPELLSEWSEKWELEPCSTTL